MELVRNGQVGYQYNMEEGEIQVTQKRRMSYVAPYSCFLLGGQMQEEQIEQLLTLSHCALRTYLYFMRHLNKNMVVVSLHHTAAALMVSPKTIYHAVTDLKKHNLLYRVKRGVYLMNPRVVWCGKDESYPTAIEQWDAITNSNIEGI